MTQYPGKTPDKDEWVSKFASFCMKNLRRTYLNGARAIMPASVEMEAIRVSWAFFARGSLLALLIT